MPIITALREVRQENPWGLLDTQPSQITDLKFSERPYLRKLRGGMIKRKHELSATGLDVCTHTHTHTHTHSHKHIHTEDGKRC